MSLANLYFIYNYTNSLTPEADTPPGPAFPVPAPAPDPLPVIEKTNLCRRFQVTTGKVSEIYYRRMRLVHQVRLSHQAQSLQAQNRQNRQNRQGELLPLVHQSGVILA